MITLCELFSYARQIWSRIAASFIGEWNREAPYSRKASRRLDATPWAVIFLLASICLSNCLSNPAYANIYRCAVQNMVEESRDGIKIRNDSVWIKLYKEIFRSFVYNENTGLLSTDYSDKIWIIDRLQFGNDENSSIGIFIGQVGVSRPVLYLKIKTFVDDLPFIIDFFGNVFGGSCERAR